MAKDRCNSFDYYWNLKVIEAFARMTREVTCLETYKNVKTKHCSKTWINLHRFLGFANTRILPKTCPLLSWDQALLSFSWVKRFQPAKQIEKSHIKNSTCVPEWRCNVTSEETCSSIVWRVDVNTFNQIGSALSSSWTCMRTDPFRWHEERGCTVLQMAHLIRLAVVVVTSTVAWPCKAFHSTF